MAREQRVAGAVSGCGPSMRCTRADRDWGAAKNDHTQATAQEHDPTTNAKRNSQQADGRQTTSDSRRPTNRQVDGRQTDKPTAKPPAHPEKAQAGRAHGHGHKGGPGRGTGHAPTRPGTRDRRPTGATEGREQKERHQRERERHGPTKTKQAREDKTTKQPMKTKPRTKRTPTQTNPNQTNSTQTPKPNQPNPTQPKPNQTNPTQTHPNQRTKKANQKTNKHRNRLPGETKGSTTRGEHWAQCGWAQRQEAGAAPRRATESKP